MHNAYERDESPFDQIVWARAHSLEFDIHTERRAHRTLDGDWYVYHFDVPGFNATSCTKLSDCLGQLRAYHFAHPKHEVVTLLIDLKDDFAPGHTPEDLDARIAKHIDPEWIVSPGELVGGCPNAATLQGALRGGCGWPRLDALRGKFFFAMTGGSACDTQSHVSQYCADGVTARNRLGFVAPSVTTACSIRDYLSEKPHVGFLNIDLAHVASATLAHDAGLVARVYDGGYRGGLDDKASWDQARIAKAPLLATDRVNFAVDSWAATHNQYGWPFSCFGSCGREIADETRAVGVTVDSGDLFGDRDDFFFASRATGDENRKSTWTSSIAVPSSHTDDLGKACLMARASQDADAPYAALCRMADAHPLRVQYRVKKGGPTETVESRIIVDDTFTPESAFLTRLTVTTKNGSSDVLAEASLDGATWTAIDTVNIDATLSRQGIAASSHGSGPMRFVFDGLTLATGGGGSVGIDAADLAGKRVGACRVGNTYDGVLP